ncbi:RNA-guided endonuclease IscB [Streptomyces sp. NPDC058256]|uniref:RNA-guided endonuclease IscB n=1 Tax=Streptomyces sp. NPDC058256 TaxID=3346408 RepID=UPI0036EC22CB
MRDGDVPAESSTSHGTVSTGARRVFVLAKDGSPLMPCHPGRARELLARGRAVVTRHTPFTIRLKDRTKEQSAVDGVQMRIDPGSKATGIAITDEKKEIDKHGALVGVRRGLVGVELQHRGQQISKALEQRAGYRRRRRSVNLRYRAPRFDNRARPRGWLAPSLRHRVETTVTMVDRLRRVAPVTEIHVERVAFDVHAMSAGRDLSAAEYQHGTLAGTEVREYLLAKWKRMCAYCGATGVPLNIDHIQPRCRGGSDRVSNLTLACVPCNQAKGSARIEDFLSSDPQRLARILGQTKTQLRDSAAMNTTNGQLTEALKTTGIPVYWWSGGRTKWNRTTTGLAKTHTLDALAVGSLDHEQGDAIVRVPKQVLVVTATGRGSYARTRPDKYGFPRLLLTRTKRHYGYQTGDLVRATVPSGKRAGTYVGRVAVRSSGSFNITTVQGTVQGIRHKRIRLLQRADGYAYTVKPETT